MTKPGDRNRTRRRYLCGLLLRGFASPLGKRDEQSTNFPVIDCKVAIPHIHVVVLHTLMQLTDHFIVFAPFSFNSLPFYQNPMGKEPLQMLLRRGSSVQLAPPESFRRGSG